MVRGLRAAIAAGVTVLVVLSVTPPLTADEAHQDPRIGFKVRAPKDFSKIPLQPEEEWIVARWMSDRAYYQVDKTTGWSHDHKPEMNVIAFLDANTKKKEDVSERKAPDGNVVKTVIIKNPYKDYRDYLKRTYNEGGFYIASEEKSQVEGVSVECLEIKVERGAFGGPRKIVTWIYDLDIADVAVQFELFETAWPKVKADVLSSLRSFRVIPREGAAPNATSTGGVGGSGLPGLPGPLGEIGDDWSKLPPSLRTAKKMEAEKLDQAKLAKDLPDGWTAKKIRRVFVLSHIDEKTAERYAADASAVLDWLDENLGWVGPGEYVRDPVVRICKDWDEERMYDKGSGWSWGREIVTHKDLSSWSSGIGPEAINRACMEHWFRERDNALWWSLPFWLETGLRTAFANSRAKGRKIEFFNDSWERVGIAEQLRAGKFSSLRDLMRMESENLWSMDSNKSDECAAAARFLLTGTKKAKEALKAYLQALGPIAKKEAEERKKAAEASSKTDKPKTEEEEEAAFKQARTKAKDSEKKRLDAVFQVAFGAWTDADWKSLDIAYQKSLD